ncbi:hypothetical protein T4E_6457 [Trichinella pseudospiralis]|uniref:Uncharacterized protein n=1 Tax=Trichinella pseudospiralis TaxID=6337 RepID=A0A0V0Y0P1_TRIPS|nr:hypothetical protein T4E_6457 [Trichinella pseudospiralis]
MHHFSIVKALFPLSRPCGSACSVLQYCTKKPTLATDNIFSSAEYFVRKDFIKSIAFVLPQPYLRSRLDCKSLNKNYDYRLKLNRLSLDKVAHSGYWHRNKKKICKFCHRKDDRKTKTVCSECTRHVCSFYAKMPCINCAAKAAEEAVTDD